MAATAVEIKSTARVFNGRLIRFTHQSQETRTPMTCAVYIPTTASDNETFPVLIYLSGLTCTDENVCQKSGIFKKLSELRMGFVAPDTSPRGAGIPGETDSWDLGAGAGFYLDATAEPWAQHYKMYSYITKELMTVLKDHFTALDLTRMGVTGHSMGGHGALTIALKNQHMFKSVSAFAPICNPKLAPWGQKAFGSYLADPEQQSDDYDSCAVLTALGKSVFDDILIDVGGADTFLKSGQLLPENFAACCQKVGQKATIRIQEDFDHSYYFVSSFIDDHVEFHAARMG